MPRRKDTTNEDYAQKLMVHLPARGHHRRWIGVVAVNIIQTRVETIGPSEAQHYLDNMYEGNRRASDIIVFKYARAMDEGRFESLNGQTIVVGPDGKLYDGQHRMEAIVLSGVTLPFLVVVDENAAENFKTLDQNRIRTAGQFGRNMKNKAVVDGVAKHALCISKGATLSDALKGRLPTNIKRLVNSAGVAPKLKPDMMEIVDFEQEHMDLLSRSARFGATLYDATIARGVSAVVLGFAAYLIMRFGDSSQLESFRKAVVADVPVDKPSSGLLKSIRKGLRENTLTKELTVGFVLADYAYFLEGENKAASVTQAQKAFDIMARRIEQVGTRVV